MTKMAPSHNKCDGVSFLRTMIRKAIMCVATALLALTAAGQGVLSGTVSELGSGAPLELVNVGVPGTPMGAVTDRRGHYRLEIKTGDSITVRYTFTGYEPQERRVRLAGGREERQDIILKPSARRLTASRRAPAISRSRTRAPSRIMWAREASADRPVLPRPRGTIFPICRVLNRGWNADRYMLSISLH